MNLSRNFTLEELIESETARQYNITEQFTPPVDVINNLTILCLNLLQPLRDALGPISISSGYRCPRLNSDPHINGVSDSQHLTGQAADCEFHGAGGNQKIIDTVKSLNLPFDQLIDESALSWVHLSYSTTQNRREMERMVNGVYEPMT